MTTDKDIELLDKETIDKIAAGEVVERPASVAKELIENAIDAGAKNITIEWRDGGISFLRVTDDGAGIRSDQLKMAFTRHSTSKLRTIKDLDAISSLGFRGEALSSIAAVSKTEVFTKTADEMLGTHYVIEGSEEVGCSEVAAPRGTSVFVRQHFYNTPVRRKFLKSPLTEGNYINELSSRIALSHPEISFSLIGDGKEKLFTSGNGKLFDCIYNEEGKDTAARLLDLSYADENMTVQGFLGQPELRRSNRNREIFFVNGRYIKSRVLSKALEDAYQGFLMLHQYPFCVLFLTFPPGALDVNVHPRKAEVRFSDDSAVYDGLYAAVRGRLKATVDIPKVDFSADEKTIGEPIEKAPEVYEKARLDSYKELHETAVRRDFPSAPALTPQASIPAAGIISPEASFSATSEKISPQTSQPFTDGQPSAIRDDAVSNAERPAVTGREKETWPAKGEQISFLSEEAKKDHRIIGQIFRTYWLVEYAGSVYIIDQHAAHEKVLYERLMRDYEKKEMTSQLISPPIVVTLSPQEETAYAESREAFRDLGFEIENFGGAEYTISAVPGNLYSLDPEDIFLSTLADLADGKRKAVNESLLIRVATMACKAAVKGNMALPEAQARALIDELLTLDNPYHCPHGRPTMIEVSERELEKRFKRIV